MPSSASAVTSRQDRSALYLAAVALAALAISLLLALASVALQRTTAIHHGAARPTVHQPVVAAQPPDVQPRNAPLQPPIAQPRSRPRTPSSVAGEPPSLWTVLAPWALGVDGFAVLGMVAVLALRRGARRNGGPGR
jgi:membrane protein implicated in regulation of membrane protease activity